MQTFADLESALQQSSNEMTFDDRKPRISSRLLIQVSTLVIAIFQLIAYRTSVFQEDGVAYLDMARQFLGFHWLELINAAWSPLYPLLLTLVVGFQPAISWYCLFCKLVNLVAFLFMMFAFEVMLHFLLKQKTEIGPDLLANVLTVGFACASLGMNAVFHDTPDTLVSAFFYLCIALLLAFRFNPRILYSLLLGICCALGFWAKTIFLPLGLCFITLFFFVSRNLRSTAISLLVFVLGCAPIFLGSLIKYNGLPMLDVGKMNYLQIVTSKYHDHYPSPPECEHQVQILYSDPPVYYFTAPNKGTSPIWYDRAYWLRGFKVTLDWNRSVIVGIVNAGVFLYYLLGIAAGMLLLNRDQVFTLRGLRDNYIFFVPGLFLIALYSISTNLMIFGATRYYAPAIVSVLAGFLCALRVPPRANRKKLLIATLFIIPLLLRCSDALLDDLRMYFCERPADWKIAQDLKDLGVTPGSKVAQIGFYPKTEWINGGGFGKIRAGTNYTWAHLANVQIVSDIPDAAKFWSLPTSEQDSILQRIHSLGVTAVVLYWNAPTPPANSRWQRLVRSGCFAYVFK